jgi:mannose-6-phosphate isomerase-like protein (cupin superfamily)
MTDFLTLKNRHTGETLRMRRIRDARGQMILTLDGSLPPGTNGPPPHIHFYEHEEGTVKAGTFGARVGNKRIVVTAGESAALPKGVVHAWWNEGNDMLEFSGRVVPVVDFDRYLQAIFAVMNAGPSGKPPIFYLAHVLWRHRHTQQLAMPPRAIQRILFPLVLFIGRLLGKYRGDAWPGSPASCLGAPESSSAHAHSA